MSKRTNEEWLAALRGEGPEQHAALEDLREYLLRAVYVYLSRHRSDLTHLDPEELRQLSQDWAQEALLAILEKLDTFRGDSLFTTWAFRVVIHLAAGKLRQRRWSVISLDSIAEEGESSALEFIVNEDTLEPETAIVQKQLWEALRQAIEEELTDRQRTVLVGAVFQGLSVEQLARRLNTNRNNVYKIMHDARKKLKQRLTERGLTEEAFMAAFS